LDGSYVRSSQRDHIGILWVVETITHYERSLSTNTLGRLPNNMRKVAAIPGLKQL